MYLKSIEAHGFKAFANKIRLEFNQGITGIVGPNGSGKSNIADAVRWVLGEQSAKQLRGSSMQDVIFSGTENRKPLGFAYVTLTLDNSDHWLPIAYDEVTVGRRVYRSGESEYLINGAVCRLRDVQELFFDTGIGKEGYSLIGQGQIDKIVSSKPEDRREIFDEAAGIVKYKRRKSSAEKNLETEKLNLSRVNDILSEIEKQIGPLQKQYEKAKIYLKLKDELKVLEIVRFITEYEQNTKALSELDEKLEIVNRDLTDTRKQYELSKNEYEALLGELEKRQQLLDRTKEEKNQAVLEKQKAENDIRLFSEQILTIKAGEEHFVSRMDALMARRKNYENEAEEYGISLEKAETELAECRKRCEESEKALNAKKEEIAGLMQKESEISHKRMETLSENAKVRTELERFNTMGEQHAIRKAELNARLLSLQSEISANNTYVESARMKLKEVSDQVIGQAKVCDEAEESNKALIHRIHEATDNLQRKKQEQMVSESKLDTLKNLSERYEGYGNAVRKIMEEKKRFPGICGVVADLIKTEGELETAIETALGGNIQNIITDTVETAKECIDFLKQGRLGRATFIPLDGVRAKKDEFDAAVFTMKGVIGIASGLVSCEEQYEEAIKYLLGRFLVVDTIENAVRIEKKYNYKYRIVTKDGELFQPGGAISGGSFKNNSNLLGRRRELETLIAFIDSCGSDIEELEKKIADMRQQRSDNEKNQEEIKALLSSMYVDQNTAKMNLNHALEQTGELIKRKDELQRELDELEKDSSELKESLTKLGIKIDENNALTREEEEKANEIVALLAKARLEEDALNQDNVKNITGLNNANVDILHIRENIDRVTQEIAVVDKEAGELKNSKAGSEKELEEKNMAIEEAGIHAGEQQQIIEKADAVIEELNGATEAMNRENKRFFDRSQELSERISVLDKEDFRLKAQRDKLTETIDANTGYMWDEYELTISSAREAAEKFPETEASKKTVYELRAKIRALGDVNVNAIEDYKTTSERYEFLKTQRDDIVKAQKVLENIIEELDVDMRKQFMITFEEVGKRFDTVFKELFGGGKGTLELTEEEDVLDAGIRIIAQPPGKKLQNMMQLSGGEKALTAISLLFAILDLKPSPFCLLDEIEAALDDSNVSRFANYLKKLTSNTQFIVITHRRGTMAAADALYGITMQEKGVSTLVSVNLVENELK
ncbi:MAG: chromosome segregation protein SMC [Lachnospiraceae bacterium]